MITICAKCKSSKPCNYYIAKDTSGGFLQAKEEEERYRICNECKIKIVDNY